MSRVLSAAAMIMLASAAPLASAQDAQQPAEKPVPRSQITAQLKPGDPAPALSIKNWVKGAEIKGFEKDKVYVVEFWATWCGPCRASIPKLTALQSKLGSKGVTVIGVSTDQGGLDVVKKFVDAQGDKMNYTIALDDGKTAQNYLAAVGVNGIPHAFIVDKSGKLVWHGHPAEGMEAIIEGVVAGTFDAQKHADNMKKFQELVQKYGQAANANNWDDAEKALDEIKAVRPDQTGLAEVARYTILATGRKDLTKAMALAKKLSENEFKDSFEEMRELADKVVGTPDLPEAHRPFSIDLAKKAVALGKEKDTQSLEILAEAYKRAGDVDNAIATMKKAAEVAEPGMAKQYYDGRVNDMEELKKSKADPKPAADKPMDKPMDKPTEKPADAPKP